MLAKIDGIVPVLPTPFAEDGSVDWASLDRLVDFAYATGACAACLPAYASEFYKLSEDERRQVVVRAVSHSAGRIPVVAQVNYASASQAAENAIFAQQAGASAISYAVPRMFGLPEADLLRYFDRAMKGVEIPVIIQDFNPSGSTVSAQFAAQLNRTHPQFRYLKLEEPLMGAKVQAVLQATSGAVGVLEGWGGMYMLDLIPTGIAGVMSGLAVSDLLSRAFHLAKHGQAIEAYDVFRDVLPQIVCSLQHLEFFHHAEKMLLVARGVLPSAHVRDASMTLQPGDANYLQFVNERILALLDRLAMPRAPQSRSS